MTKQIFQCPAQWLDQYIDVLLIGCGATGSNIYDGLVQLHHGLLAVGHNYGLRVTAYDGDSVESPNIGRQRFTSADLGQNKAVTLVNRYNLAYGLNWKAIPQYYDAEQITEEGADLVITCVDTAKFRANLGTFASSIEIEDDDQFLWLDTGNASKTAQVVLGHLYNTFNPDDKLPNVFDLYPELATMEESNEPSCSLAEAIRSQDLFVNRAVADSALNILWQLLRTGSITHHGVFIDQTTSEIKPLKIDRNIWRFMGYERKAGNQ